MNFRVLKNLLFAAACVLFSRTVPAQTLPQLPTDSRIRQGLLGCGASYYMVENPSEKGYTYITVVQKDTLSAEKQDFFKESFLGRMGVIPGKEGFLSQREGCTFYRFPRVPSYRSQALDSTLLFTFSQMALTRAPQALVVSGDIDPAELKKKMDIFSMLIPRLKDNTLEAGQAWDPEGVPEIRMERGRTPSVKVSYSSARIPQSQMNTAQALVTDMFWQEFQVVLRHRLEKNLKQALIPYAGIRFSRLGSEDTRGDEEYGVEIFTCRDSLAQAGSVLSRTLAELGTYGVSTKEFSDAKGVLAPSFRQKADAVPSNREDTDRCLAHFLYGANLAPFSEEAALFGRKNVTDEVEAGLFNNFSSALLQQLSNLTLTYRQAPDSLDSMEALFRYNLAYLQGWVAPSTNDYAWHGADTLGLRIAASRVRISQEKAEPVTGGTLWTFSNGMRVAYKRIPGSGMFSYAWQLNGGLSRIPDLKEGEGGFIPEVLSLYNAGDLKAAAFRDVLAANGITLQGSADLNSFYIKGNAPSGKLLLVLKALSALSKERSLNRAEAKAFLRNAPLAPQSVEDRVDGLLNPHYQYTSAKVPEALSAETLTKADTYFRERFSQVNDGILVLSGDLDPGVVKKLLLKYIGAFPTAKSSASSRRQVHFRTLSGTTTYSEEGQPRGLYVLMDADVPFTAVNYPASFVAAEAVKDRLAGHLAGSGFTSSVEVKFISHPQERLRMLVRCLPTESQAGEADLMQALQALRAAVQDAASTSVSAQDFTAWKQLANNKLQAFQNEPEAAMEAVLYRYAIGKDLGSRSKENINAIQADGVSTLLKALWSGGRIEYIAP